MAEGQPEGVISLEFSALVVSAAYPGSLLWRPPAMLLLMRCVGLNESARIVSSYRSKKNST